MLLCLCLWLKRINTRFSPFLSVLFLFILFFFTTFKVVFCSCHFVVVFLAVFLGRAVRFFFAFCCTFFARLAQQYIRRILYNFCCVNDVVFVVFRGLFVLLLFPLDTPLWSYVSNNAPPAFFYAPCHQLFASLHSTTLMNTLPTHLCGCAPSSRIHIRSCLW